ncbi:uncharacterized protein APUU_41318A [Aspergillus puulaauensis]|uniref:DUF7053 domain-containing protein n=1 Tax=Aspergillus puulaauensis TaxID=1220207 RepID=A0A7R7XP83_9EURO|nr:uncharacterized protein APUU_41318A [Aspergillus puulaauensis]BCS24874.1 hypothetical protein APUU_41318A [Aspergillus puulaauensis]
MLRKKEIYTSTTPIPPSVPRQLALDILHSHSEIITLNPLVLAHHPVKAPRSAPADEFYSTWYEITQRVQYVPGMGRVGSGKISFKGCFQDEDWGLATHVYAPLGVDLRNRYRIENSPGKGQDGEGLLLCVDTELECNITLMSTVKGQQSAASKALIDRFVKKAELVDAGVLQASVKEDGKLRTFNPADRSLQPSSPLYSGSGSGDMSRWSSYQMPDSPMAHSQAGSVSSHVNSQRSEPSRTFAAELPAEPVYQPYRPGSGGGNAMQLPDTSSLLHPPVGHSAELPAETKPGRWG